MRFVEFRGRWESLTLLINVGILVLIWWSSYRLTRDCSFIERAADPGGTGLMESLGMDNQESSKKYSKKYSKKSSNQKSTNQKSSNNSNNRK